MALINTNLKNNYMWLFYTYNNRRDSIWILFKKYSYDKIKVGS